MPRHFPPCSPLTYPPSRAPPVPELVHTDESVHSLVDVDSPHVSSVPSDFESQPIKTVTQAERIQHEEEERQRLREERETREAKEAAEKAKEKTKRAAQKVKDNPDHPVVFGNSVAIAAFGAALGFGAYRKYTAGELTWKVAGAWAGVVGLFALGDYYVSR